MSNVSAAGMRVDIVIPVYNEGREIMRALESIARQVRTPVRILLCYDQDNDSTLEAIRAEGTAGLEVLPVKNEGQGAHGAVMTGLRKSESDIVLVFPADDDYNAGILDDMFRLGREGADIVCASRFMKGGSMHNCPWVKAVLVRTAAFTLRHLARIPTHDPTNGLRLFSRRLLERVSVQSTKGFTYSLELLAKCHRLGWPIVEIPATWIERRAGTSRFRILAWVPPYLRWCFYIFATTYLRLRPSSVDEAEPEPAPAGDR
jgi:glycosyltransferase involved in cell wall biosynthesis